MHSRLVALAVALIGITAIAVTISTSADGDDNVGFVNDVPISRSQFDQYASVLSAGGARSVHPWQVLLSLVNQRLALQEAHRLGYSVSEEQLESAVDALAGDGVSIDVVGGSSGGPDAFRERMRVRILFERVKATVTNTIAPTDADVRRYLDRYAPLYEGVDWTVAKAEVEPAVLQLLVDRHWTMWLSVRRSCASIKILIAVQLPADAPAASCP